MGIGETVKVIAAEEGDSLKTIGSRKFHSKRLCTGISAFWKGIGAAWLREASLRLGFCKFYASGSMTLT